MTRRGLDDLPRLYAMRLPSASRLISSRAGKLGFYYIHHGLFARPETDWAEKVYSKVLS